MDEHRTCGCVFPADGPRVFCGDGYCKAMIDGDVARTEKLQLRWTVSVGMEIYTHIRATGHWADEKGHLHFAARCGEQDPGCSIDIAHYRARLTRPDVAGHLERLPEPLCPACVEGAV